MLLKRKELHRQISCALGSGGHYCNFFNKTGEPMPQQGSLEDSLHCAIGSRKCKQGIVAMPTMAHPELRTTRVVRPAAHKVIEIQKQ